MVGAERRLGDVAVLVVATAKNKLSEEACATEFVEEFIDHRDQEFVLDHLGIDGAIVDAE